MTMNRLAREQSVYLRHAAHQKIDWHPWSEDAFDAARRENKPVFLSSGAAWCHWCHVMAAESFEDEETAELLNELFISIKLDRDERPDIDHRFQQAVAAMGSGSGWPLSVFLTPGKEPFFGGTYFPPEERQGRPGFKDVLLRVSNFFRTKKSEAESYAAAVMGALKPDPFNPEDLNEGILDEALKGILSRHDPVNGGFGTAPKFPMPGALEFLLRRFAAEGSEAAGEAARRTLLAMARGGFHDQLGGGFHRYSVDEAWIVPHFEKMADDNAGLLRNYVDGYALFGDEIFRDIAGGIIDFTSSELADPAGGFYASQDADVTPDDEGGYFTWTDAELRTVLTRDQYEIISHCLVHERGRMHHDPSKTVLAVTSEAGEIAQKLGKSPETIAEAIRVAKRALLARRRTRIAPLVDRAFYTSLNGMMIAAYLRAFMVLGRSDVRDFALKSLARILSERVEEGKLYHATGVHALLDDYIHLIDALVMAYEATGDRGYLDRAEEFLATCTEKFFDKAGGGFFDTEGDVLETRLKRIEDVPHPSANGAAIMVLLKLSFMSGKEAYRREAERMLRIFAGPARAMGVHAGTYFCALSAYYRRSSLTVESFPENPLVRAARSAAARSYSWVTYGPDTGRVIACLNNTCSPPVSEASALDILFRNRLFAAKMS